MSDRTFGGGRTDSRRQTPEVLSLDSMVECRACDGHGYHVRKRSMTSDPHATCDVVEFDCGYCDGTGQTTLARAEHWDTRRGM